jgi:hypothetical protein
MVAKKDEKSHPKEKSKSKKIANGRKAIADFTKLLNNKRLESNLRIYEAKRPLAIYELQQIRLENPMANPPVIEQIIDSRLRSVEATKGAFSTDFSGAASIYFLTSMELRQFQPDKDDTNQMWLSLMFLLDSRGYRVANRIVKAVIWIIKIYLASKATKAVAGAVASKGTTKVVVTTAAKATFRDKAAEVVKDSLLPAALELTKDQVKKARFANSIIKQSQRQLGPVPEEWNHS